MRFRDWARFAIHQYRGSSLAASIAIERLLKEGPWFDEAIERGARSLCYHRTECDTYWDERPETHDDWRRSAEAVLLAALGEDAAETVRLTPESMRQIADAIENPPEPTEALRSLWGQATLRKDIQ